MKNQNSCSFKYHKEELDVEGWESIFLNGYNPTVLQAQEINNLISRLLSEQSSNPRCAKYLQCLIDRLRAVKKI